MAHVEQGTTNQRSFFTLFSHWCNRPILTQILVKLSLNFNNHQSGMNEVWYKNHILAISMSIYLDARWYNLHSVLKSKACPSFWCSSSLWNVPQVCRMASDYSRTCVSPDSIQTGEAPLVSETCEVYVWGSNSSHQLVEGTQEKILQPKLAPSFADAQTVSEAVKRIKSPVSGIWALGKFLL